MEVDSSATSEAEANPVLLFYVSIVEWKVNGVDWLIVPLGVNGESCLQLHVLNLGLGILNSLDASRGIDHVLEITNFVELYCLNGAHLVISDETVSGHLHTVALSLRVVHIAHHCV